MVIFNQTFSDDKPIYFPDNWRTGKTQSQLYQEWKGTFEGQIYANVIQIAAASVFVGLLYAFFLGFKQLHRLYNLREDDREKIRNRQYLRPSFLAPLACVGFMLVAMLVFAIWDGWLRVVVLKGFSFCLFCSICYHSFRTINGTVRKYWTSKGANSNSKRVQIHGK